MSAFIFYSDAGHGWLQVHIADLAPVGLCVKDFTKYSYTREDYLFLEEDEDAGRFMRAYVAKNGKEPDIHNIHKEYNSEIRSYTRLRDFSKQGGE